MVAHFARFRCREWGQATGTWVTVTNNNLKHHNGIVNFITIDRVACFRFVRLERCEAQNREPKHVRTRVTPDVEADLLEDAKDMIEKTVEETKPLKAADDRRDRKRINVG